MIWVVMAAVAVVGVLGTYAGLAARQARRRRLAGPQWWCRGSGPYPRRRRA